MHSFRAQFGRRSGQRLFGASFLAAFGTLWLVVEPASLFFPHVFTWGWPGYLVLILASVAIATYRSRPRDSISRPIPPTDVSVNVRVGDVLDQTGNVIVASNDVFDTEFAEEIISPASLQGQLLVRFFNGDHTELDREIAPSLANAQGEEDVDKEFGKRIRYPVGTVAIVRREHTRYFLPAIARMSSCYPAHVTASIDGFEAALAKTWSTINAAGQREPVHAPIVGSHLARLGLSRTLLAQMIILSFIAATRKGGPPSLTLWIAPQDRDNVDILELDQWLRGLCAA